jgi:hypothetical protein
LVIYLLNQATKYSEKSTFSENTKVEIYDIKGVLIHTEYTNPKSLAIATKFAGLLALKCSFKNFNLFLHSTYT